MQYEAQSNSGGEQISFSNYLDPGRVGFSIGHLNEIALFNTKTNPASAHRLNGKPGNVILRWDQTNLISREKIAESHSEFISLQRAATRFDRAKENSERMGQGLMDAAVIMAYKNALQRSSRHYRVLLSAHRQQLRQQIKDQRASGDVDAQTELAHQIVLLDEQEKVWHFAEIVHIIGSFLGQPEPNAFLLPHLLEWVKKFSPDSPERLSQYIRDIQTNEQMPIDDVFWQFIFTRATQGQLTEVSSVLALLLQTNQIDDSLTYGENSHSTIHLVSDVIELLSPENVPRLHSRADPQDFYSEFNQWLHYIRELQSKYELKDINGPAAVSSSAMYDDDDDGDEGASNDQIHVKIAALLRIILGDDDTLITVSRTWYELLVAQLLYKFPMTTGLQAVVDLAESCKELKYSPPMLMTNDGAADSADFIDRVLYALLDSEPTDLMRAVFDCGAVFDPWFTAHFVDLLYHCAKIDPTVHDNGYETDTREYFILEYAEHIYTNRALWRIAMDYLTYCPRKGLPYMQEFIDRLPIESETTLNKLEAFCNQFNETLQPALRQQTSASIISASNSPIGSPVPMTTESETEREHVLASQLKNAHTVFAVKNLHEFNNSSAAIKHLLQSGDLYRISRITDAVLDDYIRAEKTEDVERANHNLASIAACVEAAIRMSHHRNQVQPTNSINTSFLVSLQSEKLAFVHRYNQLKECMKLGNYTEAGRIIIHLLSSSIQGKSGNLNVVSGKGGTAPRRFWMVLLMDAVGLLENTTVADESNTGQQLIFDANETYVLMNCLEEVILSHRSNEYLKGITSEDIQTVRLALARNLSRAFIYGPPLTPFALTPTTGLRSTTWAAEAKSNAPFGAIPKRRPLPSFKKM